MEQETLSNYILPPPPTPFFKAQIFYSVLRILVNAPVTPGSWLENSMALVGLDQQMRKRKKENRYKNRRYKNNAFSPL